MLRIRYYQDLNRFQPIFFFQFRSEMHIIDTMILSAMKASFEGLTSIKDQCEVLDMFYSMSERSRFNLFRSSDIQICFINSKYNGP